MSNSLPKAMLAFCIIIFFMAAERSLAQLPWPQVTFHPASSSTYDQNASVTVTEPSQGELVTLQRDCDTCPAYIYFEAEVDNFDLMALSDGVFPCEPQTGCDTCQRWKGNGQHLYLVVDKASNVVVTDLNTPVRLPVDDTTAGPHTLRVYMSRSWDESLKGTTGPARSTDLYTVRTFYLDTITGTHAIDTTLPLLTPNSPLDTNHYKYPPDSVLFDFYMMFKGLSDGYVVEVTVFDSTMTALGRDSLDQWVPYCIEGLEEPPIGHLRKYYMQVRLLTTSGTPVANGPGNFNNRQWPFWIRRR